MKIVRIQTHSEVEGLFSEYHLCCEAKDRTKFAKNYSRTYSPVTVFKVFTLRDTGSVISVILMDGDKEIDRLDFNSEFVMDRDENVTAIFTLKDNKKILYSENNDNNMVETDKVSIYFGYTFIGYKPGSLYRLFDIVVKSGYFCKVDPSSEMPGYTKEDLDKIKQRKKDLETKKKEYTAAKKQKAIEERKKH